MGDAKKCKGEKRQWTADRAATRVGGDFKGPRRINDTHASRADPDSQLFHKSHGVERDSPT